MNHSIKKKNLDHKCLSIIITNITFPYRAFLMVIDVCKLDNMT